MGSESSEAGGNSRFVNDVRKFREKFGLTYAGKPRGLPMDESQGIAHMKEEVAEFESAHFGLMYELGKKHLDLNEVERLLESQLDAVVDLIFVAVGVAAKMGFVGTDESVESKLEIAWDRVFEANMKKVRASLDNPSKRGDPNDVVKPKGWQPPDHRDLVTDNVYASARVTTDR